jgi:hypothetical protein
MEKKFKMTIRELLISSKDYSNYTEEELIMQYDIIMNEYEDFKNQLGINNDISENPKLEYIKYAQRMKQERFNKKIIQEIDNHLEIMRKLMYSE